MFFFLTVSLNEQCRILICSIAPSVYFYTLRTNDLQSYIIDSIKGHSTGIVAWGIPDRVRGLVMQYKAQECDLRFVTRTTTSQVSSPSPNLSWNPSILTPSLARYQLLTLQMQRKSFLIILEVIFSTPPTMPEIDIS